MSTSPEQILERLTAIRDQARYYGLILGGILIFIELLSYWQHDTLTTATILLFPVFKIVVIFMSTYHIVKRIKESIFSEGVDYKQLVTLIFRLFFYASLVVGVFTFILNRWIDPEYMSTLLDNTLNLMQTNMDSTDMLESHRQYFDSLMEELTANPTPTPIVTMWNTMWSYTMWGVFVGLVLSFFLKDKKSLPLN